MTMLLAPAAAIAGTVILGTAGSAAVKTIPTSDRRQVEVEVIGPTTSGKHPTLIVAPGAHYARHAPIIADLSRRGADAGWVVVTFDWSYTPRNGRPSPHRELEALDLEAVLAYARSLPAVDSRQIYLAGKSLGSMVADAVFAQHTELAGLVLYTPVGRTVDELRDHYAALRSTRPLVILLGAEDTAACPLATLYAALRDVPRPPPVVVVGGDHGFIVSHAGRGTPSALDTANVQAANRMALHWLDLMRQAAAG